MGAYRELVLKARRSQLEPHGITYDAALGACEKAKQREHLLMVWLKLRRAQREPIGTICGSAISARKKAMLWEHTSVWV